MPKCPLTYEEVSERYSPKGLKRLAHGLATLHELPFDAEALRLEATLRAGKMSVQGMQPKLSAVLSVKKQAFELVDTNGRFILKPPTHYPHLPENEDLTMRLAALSGIEVPTHGLIYAKDKSLVYFIKRFDRAGHTGKVPVEDFAQLAGETRDTKYNYSMERLAEIIEAYCTFPVVEKAKLLQRTIFNFVVGNEDMHLKNFSLITSQDVVRLAPAYDLLNSSIVLRDPEEIALPIRGKKRGLSRKILLDYYGMERLGLTQSSVDQVLASISSAVPSWRAWIEKSFLPQDLKDLYTSLVNKRLAVLGIMEER